MLLQITLAITLIGVTVPSDTTKIPLKEIWALKMQGTKDIRKLDVRKNAHQVTEIMRINEALMIAHSKRKPSGPCFLVTGEGKEALRKASEVIAGKKPPTKTLPVGEKLTLVFYSSPAPGYVQIRSISRSSSLVLIEYEILIHKTAEATTHIALIPLGKVTAGKVAVGIVEVEPNTPYTNHALSDRAVCDPGEFIIEKKGIP